MSARFIVHFRCYCGKDGASWDYREDGTGKIVRCAEHAVEHRRNRGGYTYPLERFSEDVMRYATPALELDRTDPPEGYSGLDEARKIFRNGERPIAELVVQSQKDGSKLATIELAAITSLGVSGRFYAGRDPRLKNMLLSQTLTLGLHVPAIGGESGIRNERKK